MGVLDSACTRTVTGAVGLNAFLDALTESEKILITNLPSYSEFRFRDGVKVKSVKRVKFPVFIGTKKVFIEANIVDNEIPILQSIDSMKEQSWSWIFLGTWLWYLMNL